MDDLVTVFRIATRHKGKLIAVSLIAGLAVFLYPRARLDYVSVSPDGTYRVEAYSPSLYQWLMNLDMEDPGFVRLYRNFDNHYFGESQVVDFFGGAGIRWNMATSGEVDAGRDIEFRNIPPVAPGGVILDIPNAGLGAGALD
jgi:hypothetical protein